MDTPPPAAAPSHDARARPLAAAARVAAVLMLCAACYAGGRWTRGLEIAAEVVAPVAAAKPAAAAALRKETADVPAPGNPAGESPDLITPLNVRDPSALIMPPSGFYSVRPAPDAAAPAPAPESAPPARVFPHRVPDPKPDLRS